MKMITRGFRMIYLVFCIYFEIPFIDTLISYINSSNLLYWTNHPIKSHCARASLRVLETEEHLPSIHVRSTLSPLYLPLLN